MPSPSSSPLLQPTQSLTAASARSDHGTDFMTPALNSDSKAPALVASPENAKVLKPSVPSSPLFPTIFHQDWWLEISTDGQYKVAEVSAGGTLIGRLPYFCKRRFGIVWNGQPNMTHFLGPAVDEGKGNSGNRFLRRISVTEELLSQLPKADFMQIKCHRDVRDVICFQKEKFRTSVQFTYEIQPQPEEVLWAQFRDKTRNVIRRASEKLAVSLSNDPDEFLAFYKQNLETKGISNYLNHDLCKNLIAEAIRRDAGGIYALRNPKGELAAAIFCVWDETSCYYLMSTRNNESGNGGVSLLIWEAMKNAMSRKLIFDFDGLYSSGGILLYSGFGGMVSPRYIATKMSLPIYLAYTLFKSAAEHMWFA